MTLYATGMRRAEICRLQIQDIDSARMMIHVRQGKGGKDRDIPLSETLLAQLRTWWRSLSDRSSPWLFPSDQDRLRGQPRRCGTPAVSPRFAPASLSRFIPTRCATMPRPGLCREDQDEPAKALGIQGVLAHRSFSTRHSPEAWD
jgi:integrase